MRYDGLEEKYWHRQGERIGALVARIKSGETPGTGRVVPELDDLVIGEGRQLRVAVLFLDISGFSALPSETLQEQDLLLRCLSLFFSEAVTGATRFILNGVGGGPAAAIIGTAAAQAHVILLNTCVCVYTDVYY